MSGYIDRYAGATSAPRLRRSVVRNCREPPPWRPPTRTSPHRYLSDLQRLPTLGPRRLRSPCITYYFSGAIFHQIYPNKKRELTEKLLAYKWRGCQLLGNSLNWFIYILFDFLALVESMRTTRGLLECNVDVFRKYKFGMNINVQRETQRYSADVSRTLITSARLTSIEKKCEVSPDIDPRPGL